MDETARIPGFEPAPRPTALPKQRMAILNVARVGKFSSDRAVCQYARDIWQMGELYGLPA